MGQSTGPVNDLKTPGSIVWRSRPTEFVETVVVDASCMGNLVHHGDIHLVEQVVEVVAHFAQGVAINRNYVGRFVAPPFGVWRAFVQTQQGWFFGIAIEYLNDHVLQHRHKLGGQLIECVGDHAFELVARHDFHAASLV